jgi:hypothetical protein
LRQGRAKHAVLVLDAGVAHAGAAHAGVPPLHVADRETGQRQAGDLILLDAAHPTLLVSCGRRRPRVEVLLHPRIEHVADQPTGRRGASRTDLHLGSDAQRLALAAVDRLGQLGRPAAGVGAGEDADLPHSRAPFAQRQILGMPSLNRSDVRISSSEPQHDLLDTQA